MTQEGLSQGDLKDRITRRAFWFVALWAAGILLLYAIGGYLGVRGLQGYKAETMKMRQMRIEAATTEPGTPAPEIKMPPGAKPVDVLVGIYINRIGEFSLVQGAWSADFDIWFRWIGDGIRPGDNFQVANGEIDQREKTDASASGEEHYERYRVKARLTKYFDPSRFPFGDEALSIQIEDGANRAETLRYIVDERSSGISLPGLPSNLRVTESLIGVKLHSYGSGRGDPQLLAGPTEVHSRFFFAMIVLPPSKGLYVKMFQALFASVAIAFIVFFIKPIHVDPRFGLGIGAVFAAVGNNIFVGTLLPQSDRITLTDMVNATGLATIFLTLVQSAISLYIEDTMGLEKLRSLFDKVSFAVFLIGYAAVNLMLPLAARP
jgi:hypothetical protein